MTIVPETPDGPKNQGLAAQELLEFHDLQNAQIDSMRHVWDNPEDEVWNDIELLKASTAQQGCNVNSSETLTDSQRDLYDRMSEISEDCYCARWLHDNEYAIWDALQGSDSTHGMGRIDPRLLRRCKLLSEEVGGWIYWADGPQFAPMAQWLAMVDARRKLPAAPTS